MSVQVSYPGVYIEEFAPGAPIQGVSTSIAAFIGQTAKGGLDKPTKVTSWDDFVAQFGDQPVGNSSMFYAVRGFFDNGGQTCFIVRASNGDYRRGQMLNRAADARAIIDLVSRQPGQQVPPNSLRLSVNRLIDGAQLYQPTGSAVTITGRTLEMNDANEAAQFRPTDWLDVGGQRVQVARVAGSQVTLNTEPGVAAPADVRLADPAPGSQVVRIQTAADLPPGTLTPGTVLTLTHNGTQETQVVETVQAEYLPLTPNPLTTYRVMLRGGLRFAIDMTSAVTVQSEEVNIQVMTNGAGPVYTALGLDPAHPRYFVREINANDASVELKPIQPPPPALFPNSLPAIVDAPLNDFGADETTPLTIADFIEALETLREFDEVSLVAIPGVTEAAVQQAMIAHCELMGDRFAVLDSMPGIGLFGQEGVEGQRRGLDSTRGYAALYYPWLWMSANNREVLVPPSGHICGIMARVDTSRGVHKAPANEIINNAVGVERTMSNQEQGLLNLQGINVLRVFQTGGRPRVWGARTTATDLNWQYINIRRLFLYMEESIQEGINWAVFEPNNLQLWGKLRRTITDFLTRVWRDGGLDAPSAEEAFYVRIDNTLNPPDQKALGRLTIEVGVRPTYPAEFIVVRIGIVRGESVTVSE